MSLIKGRRVAKSKTLLTWPWMRKVLIRLEICSVIISGAALKQSEVKPKLGSLLPAFNFLIASSIIDGVTLYTSLTLN